MQNSVRHERHAVSSGKAKTVGWLGAALAYARIGFGGEGNKSLTSA